MRRRLTVNSTRIDRTPSHTQGAAAAPTNMLGSRLTLNVLVGTGLDELHEMFEFTKQFKLCGFIGRQRSSFVLRQQIMNSLLRLGRWTVPYHRVGTGDAREEINYLVVYLSIY